MNKHLVFVYGTLRDGNRNAAILTRGGVTEWTPARLRGYHLINPDHGAYPFCQPGGNGQGPVVGELVAVDDALLERLDHLEGVPTFYQRVQVQIDNPTGGPVIVAWVYVDLHARHTGKPVMGNDWKPTPERRS